MVKKVPLDKSTFRSNKNSEYRSWIWQKNGSFHYYDGWKCDTIKLITVHLNKINFWLRDPYGCCRVERSGNVFALFKSFMPYRFPLFPLCHGIIILLLHYFRKRSLVSCDEMMLVYTIQYPTTLIPSCFNTRKFSILYHHNLYYILAYSTVTFDVEEWSFVLTEENTSYCHCY